MASVPCQTSVLVLILVSQMSMKDFLWESNREFEPFTPFARLSGPNLVDNGECL